MPLQVWDVVVLGNSHRVELDRNPETGKQLLRVDGRIVVKPFVETKAEHRFEIAGKQFVLHVDHGSYRIEDKGSRYHDTSAARQGVNLGRLTICRGLEHIFVVTDDALLRIEKLSEGLRAAAMAGTGGGLLGAVVGEVSLQLAQKATNEFGDALVNRPIRSFADLDKEFFCRLESLPLDLVTLFSDDAGLETRVLVVPRRCVTAIELTPRKVMVTTANTQQRQSKPHKFATTTQAQEALDHLCGAGYPLPATEIANASESARAERTNRLKSTPHPSSPAASSPPPSPSPAPVKPGTAAPAPRSFAGLSEVRWTAPLITTIGREPALIAQMEEDLKAYSGIYPKSVMRRVRVEDPLRNLGKERYDLVHLAGVFDDKTRFREAASGFTISLKDLIVKLIDQRVRMLWLSSSNDPAVAQPTLQWAGGLNFFVVLTQTRGQNYATDLGTALNRLSRGEPLSKILPELQNQSDSRWITAGRGEFVFLPE